MKDLTFLIDVTYGIFSVAFLLYHKIEPHYLLVFNVIFFAKAYQAHCYRISKFEELTKNLILTVQFIDIINNLRNAKLFAEIKKHVDDSPMGRYIEIKDAGQYVVTKPDLRD